MFKVDSVRLKQEYEAVLQEVCSEALKAALHVTVNVTNENGEVVKFNVGDVCNTLTQLAQAYRRDNQ
jgi:uncharacterized protein GlcG (DUF336 family)